MDSSKNILVVVPARAGSKRLKNKNRRKVGGRTLFQRVKAIVDDLDLLKSTVVSTDDPVLARHAKNLGFNVPGLRPQELSTDNATTISVVQHSLSLYNSVGCVKPEFILLLQPTSPFRNAATIRRAVNCLRANPKISAVISGSISFERSFKTLTDVYDIEIENPDENQTSYVDANGNFYLVRCKSFLETSSFFPKLTKVFIGSVEEAVDIDDLTDLLEARSIARKMKI